MTSASNVTRFHMSLNVADLTRSVEFFQRVFGVAPLKVRSDYAKFELDEPPLVLSLMPHAPAAGGALNHVGFRFATAESLVAAQRRLEMAGVGTQREEGVECCYALQNKFWVHDPDGTLWEFYVLTGDLDHRGGGQEINQMLPTLEHTCCPRPPVTWEHQLGQPIPTRLPFESGSVDEVRLRGTFNVPVEDDVACALLEEAVRALRPGGLITAHILTADRPLTAPLSLPGRASHVRVAPVQSDLVWLLERAGFRDIEFKTYRPGPCFQQGLVELRETLLTGTRPASTPSSEMREVLYRGPYASVELEGGLRLRRGERVRLPEGRATELKRGPLGDAIVLFPAPAVVAQLTACTS